MTTLDTCALASAFADLVPFFMHGEQRTTRPADIGHLMEDLAPFFAYGPKSVPNVTAISKSGVSIDALGTFLRDVKVPLNRARDEGKMGNIWELAGLKRYEVRVSAVLAELWRPDFAGQMSRNFLASYLGGALKDVDWLAELRNGYHVETEVRPVGEREDRVDVVIRTQHHLICVEVKIDAGFGHRQMERYIDSMARSAALSGRSAHVVTLAHYDPQFDGVIATTWGDVSNAAEAAAGRPVRHRGFAAKNIAMFGAYVRRFQ